ncbi:protein kinase [Pseudoalteromonas sp. SWXJZ94C]|uniref:serine/threonine-protein kinase n=1 Tax=Pseudoalteromonas sp. SWXJZ94C TaxID=2792065 RepID=UPI0018CCF39C|nr:serine/threonine-protein kinase [Pseudoalteromonas sp. SWXJZ94C]MBH0058434.1 protein kinase [Pseudoalteromonas sp. SWXJZ94C]
MSSINNNNDKTQIASLDTKHKTAARKTQLNLLGKTISGRYLIEELIGQGGMSYIYRARDTFLENASRPEAFVAIKILLEEFSHSEEAIALLKDEAVKTQQLAHPNIVKVYSADSDGDLFYVTMEWVEGETLEQIIKRNKPNGMAYKKAKVILEQLADALIYAHNQGVIHNDLKPSNVILNSNGELKVLDFGIAKQKSNDDKYAVNDANSTDSIGGYTPTYASPEQLKGNKASIKDDIFSYACIAYELLSSKHPFNRIAADKLPQNNVVKRPSHCPLWLWKDVKKALSLSAAQRPKNLESIYKSYNTNFKPAIAIAITSIAVAFLAGQYHTSTTSDLKQLEAKLDNALAINQQVETWMSWQGPSIIGQLSEIPPQYNVLKQGLLRVNQPNILENFESEANKFNGNGSEFKDFDKTITIYNKALDYYPDSEKLSIQLESVLRERQSIISDITSRIDLLLEQSRYSEEGQNNITELVSDLKTVDSNYVYQPSEVHLENFQAALNTAIENDDVNSQQSLLNVGKIVFANNKKAGELIADLLKRESAINALTTYNKKLEMGEQVVFPTQAAIVFYQPRFTRYEEKLDEITDYKDLLEFEELVNSQSDELPENFSPLLSLKKELSKRYITMANNLMKKRMYKTAEQLVERSEAITKSLDNIL